MFPLQVNVVVLLYYCIVVLFYLYVYMFIDMSEYSKDQCISLLWDKCYTQRSITSIFCKQGSGSSSGSRLDGKHSKHGNGCANGLSARISQLVTTKILPSSTGTCGVADRIIRITPSVLQLIRRIQRVFYVSDVCLCCKE